MLLNSFAAIFSLATSFKAVPTSLSKYSQALGAWGSHRRHLKNKSHLDIFKMSA
jgi:hypothetical protein